MPQDCDRAIASIARSQYGVFHLTQALHCGFTDLQVRRRASNHRWERLYPRVYRIRGAPPSRAQELVAAHLWAQGRAVFSHSTAAELHGLLTSKSKRIEMSTAGELRARDDLVKVHRRASIERRDVVSIGALRATCVDLRLLDLAARMSPAAFERCLDDVLRRGLSSVALLRWRLEQSGGPGREGTAAMRAALSPRMADYRATDSVLEDAFLDLCRRGGLPEPRRQVEIEGLGRVDFYYDDARIVIELDGYEFHWDRPAFQRDRSRSNEAGVGGLLVLRYTHSDITRRRKQVAEQLRAARASRLPAGYDPRDVVEGRG